MLFVHVMPEGREEVKLHVHGSCRRRQVREQGCGPESASSSSSRVFQAQRDFNASICTHLHLHHFIMAGHVTSGRSKSWHHHLTIDLVARVLANSIFHPFIAWLVPLCLRSLQAPYESTEFIASCVYAGVVTLGWILSIINKRVAYGLPRSVDWDEEVVVVTGGANGLGKIIAETYGMRGASVAILDVVEPERESEGLAGVKFYRCDIGEAEAVANAATKIRQDVSNASPPVIWID